MISIHNTYQARIGISKEVSAYAINFLRSVLLMPPIGLISAVIQYTPEDEPVDYKSLTRRTVILRQVAAKAAMY
jgi:hypothetical protein